jgi:hypothetical protein
LTTLRRRYTLRSQKLSSGLRGMPPYLIDFRMEIYCTESEIPLGVSERSQAEKRGFRLTIPHQKV